MQPHLRETKLLTWQPDKTLHEYLVDNDMAEGFGAAVNGHVVEDTATLISDGDCVVVMPILGSGFKDILRLIATVMLSQYVGSIMGTGGAGGWFGDSIGKYFAAGAVMYLGGRVINALLPYDKAKTSTTEESANYSWDTGSIVTKQGGVVGKTYGTARIKSPQLLAYYVSVLDDKQYLNMLLCGGEGPADNITDITIEDNPITNYSDVVVETRLGTNDQSVISNFSDTYLTQSLAYELGYTSGKESDWTTHQTNGDAGEGLELTIEFPGGLYYLDDKGNLQNATVNVAVEYRKVGDTDWASWGSAQETTVTAGANQGRGTVTGIKAGSQAFNEIWTLTCVSAYIGNNTDGNEPMYYPEFSVVGSLSGATSAAYSHRTYNNNKIGFTIIEGAREFRTGDKFTIDLVTGVYGFVAAKNTALRRTIRKDNIPAGQYEVRCRCTYKSGTDTTRYGVKIVWSELKQIIYDDFQRPNKVLVAIKALATDQLSGSLPSVKWTQRRGTVWVWNPYTSQYEAKRADSPAWASYDSYHQCAKLMNVNTGAYEFVIEGVPASRMLYDEFAAGAAYDDENVDGDKRFYFDYFFDTAQTIWDASRVASLCGRGVVVPRGVKIGYQVDKPRIPVQLFSMGNTTLKSFKGKFLAKKDRASVVEIEFTNSKNNYETETLPVYGSGYDTSTTVDNPATVSRRGIVRYKHAYREGQYAVRQNERIARTLDIDADVDGIVCQTGDVVNVQHDVPRWGAAGGRIVSATGTTVVLDRAVTMTPGETYRLIVRVSETDEHVERSIVNVGTTTDTLTLTAALPAGAAKYDVYAFGRPAAKPFTVTGMTRTGEQKIKLSLAEYDEAVYTDEDVPNIDYSELTTVTVEVSSLAVAQETYRNKDGTVVSAMHVSWRPPAAAMKSYRVLYRRQAESEWTVWNGTVTDSGAEIAGVVAQETYLVKVCTVSDIGVVSPGVTSAPILITGKDNPPSNVPSITAAIDPTDRTKITLTWPAVDDIDLRGYRLSEDATVLTPTPISDTRYVYTATSSRQHTFSVVAIDNSENSSTVPAQVTIYVKIEPPDVPRLEIAQTGETLNAFVSAINEQVEYVLRSGITWENSYAVARFNSALYSFYAVANGTQTFWIKAFDKNGYYSVNATRATANIYGLPPKNAIVERTESLVDWVNTGCYLDGYNRWNLDSKIKLGDLSLFADFFSLNFEKNDNAELVLPALDLGPNIIEEGFFYVDGLGNVAIDSVQTLGSFIAFDEWFDTVLTPQPVKYATETFASIAIGYTKSINTELIVEYRASIDGQHYGPWTSSIIRQFFGRYAQIHLIPKSLDGVTQITISSATQVVDVPDVDNVVVNKDILAVKTRVNFSRKFYATPKSLAVYTQDATGKLATNRVTNVTRDGFDLEILDGDTVIAGKMQEARARGY